MMQLRIDSIQMEGFNEKEWIFLLSKAILELFGSVFCFYLGFFEIKVIIFALSKKRYPITSKATSLN